MKKAKKSSSFSIVNFLEKRKVGDKLTLKEFEFFINGLCEGSIKDYHASAFLMSCFNHELTKVETAHLTRAMLHSGDVLKFKSQKVIDKHSTGGVGDKTSFIIAPIAHACGVKVPMMAGRGLGHTGGTIDKIESIPGFQTSMSLKNFKKQVETKGMALIGQTEQIAPADKILYALRDVTATINNIPLITASIMSKKLAEGANGIVMDIKYGNGAFMTTSDQAEALAKSMIATAKNHSKKMTCVISNMNQPLGHAIGHATEIVECIECLEGRGPQDLMELSLKLSAEMILQAGITQTFSQALKRAKDSVHNGSALKSFKELIKWQKGNTDYVSDPSMFKIAKSQTMIIAQKSGTLASVNTKELGLLVAQLGGGRLEKDEKIDLSVGAKFYPKIGEKVVKGQKLGLVFHHPGQKNQVKKLINDLNHDIIIQRKNILPMNVIYKTIRSK